MRIIWLGLCFLAAACVALNPDADIPDFNNTIVGGDPGQTIAFIGEKVAVQEVGFVCPDDSICMDARFHARYRIIELLEGKFDGKVIDFVVYDHDGYPRFAADSPVVLYVVQIGDQLYHHKYAFDALYPVRGGGYATCGDPFTDYEPALVEKLGREDLTAYTFDPPVKINFSNLLFQQEDLEEMSQDDIRDNFLETMRTVAPPAFNVNGDVATCKMGMSAKDIVRVRMRFVYTPSRLYSERHARCWKEAGLPGDGATGKAMYESGYDACMKDSE